MISLKNKLRNYCKKREIWWCKLGKNVGIEQGGKGINFSRPVLIIKVFNKDMFWGLPISSHNRSKKKDLMKYYYELVDMKLVGFVCLSQPRVFDSRRLERKITKINYKKFFVIKKLLKRLI